MELSTRQVLRVAAATGASNVTRHHSHHHSRARPYRCSTKLGLQLRLGLLSFGRRWADPGDSSYPAPAWQNLSAAMAALCFAAGAGARDMRSDKPCWVIVAGSFSKSCRARRRSSKRRRLLRSFLVDCRFGKLR
jgi:hypothetical protein